MGKIFITRHIPESGIHMLKDAGHEVTVSSLDRALHKDELIAELSRKEYDAVLCLLTDTIDEEVFEVAPKAKIFANYAVGYNNIDLEEAKRRGVIVTNTPGVLSETVAEYTFALILSVLHRIPEADRFTRKGAFEGWAPELLLGNNLRGKTLGIVGTGRIGSEVVRLSKAFGAEVIYTDLKRNEVLEKETGAVFVQEVDDVFKKADIVSLHVPLLESTRHLADRDRLALMKKGSYLINTSRGAVVDEKALVAALKEGRIRAAGLDVFEHEPKLSAGLIEFPETVLTPHIASATEGVRGQMAELAAQSIIDTLAGKKPKHVVS